MRADTALGVVPVHHGLLLVRHLELDGVARIVEVPVRIVGGEQHAVPADPVDHLDEMRGIVRLLDRLGRVPEMLAQIFRRRALEVRHFLAHALPMLVHAPAERRRPGVAGLDRHHLELRKALEHAFHDHAHDHRLLVRQEGVVLLHVIGRPAGTGGGMSAVDVGVVLPERQARRFDRLIDRPVARAGRAARWRAARSTPARTSGPPRAARSP